LEGLEGSIRVGLCLLVSDGALSPAAVHELINDMGNFPYHLLIWKTILKVQRQVPLKKIH